MKKVIFLIMLSFGLFTAAEAQTSYNLLHSNGGSQDTVDNTETLYLTLASTVPQNRLWQTAFVVYSYTEASGTSAGTATLQLSANGTDWVNVAPDSLNAEYAAFTHTDVTTQQTYSWTLAPFQAYKLRVKVTGVGTMSGIVKGSVVFKNH